MKQILLLIGATILLAYCSSHRYIPSSWEIQLAQKQWEQADSTYLSKGNQLYELKCSGCHYLYIPKNYSVEQWKKILPEMRNKAKLSNEEYEKIKVYLLTRSEIEYSK